MIIDRIENAARYYQLGKGIADAFEYLVSNDLSKVSPGNYEIIKDKVRMIVSDSKQTNTDRIRMEGHRKYIDIQYWIDGTELMGHAFLQSQKIIEPYNEERDCGFYAGEATFYLFKPGMFVIYFPTDLHTAVADEQCDSAVKKIVFKVIV